MAAKIATTLVNCLGVSFVDDFDCFVIVAAFETAATTMRLGDVSCALYRFLGRDLELAVLAYGMLKVTTCFVQCRYIEI